MKKHIGRPRAAQSKVETELAAISRLLAQERVNLLLPVIGGLEALLQEAREGNEEAIGACRRFCRMLDDLVDTYGD